MYGGWDVSCDLIRDGGRDGQEPDHAKPNQGSETFMLHITGNIESFQKLFILK